MKKLNMKSCTQDGTTLLVSTGWEMTEQVTQSPRKPPGVREESLS